MAAAGETAGNLPVLVDVRKPLATITELAEYLGVPVHTVYSWNAKGTGPKPLKVGRHVRYHWEDIDKWLESQRS